MCGEIMRLVRRETIDKLPGSHQTAVTKTAEWVCPECDYFEDAENVES
jgi:hypothetical protein